MAKIARFVFLAAALARAASGGAACCYDVGLTDQCVSASDCDGAEDYCSTSESNCNDCGGVFCSGQPAPSPSVPPPAPPTGIRIALYGGDGAILGDEDYPYQKTIQQAAAALGESSVTVLLEEGVRLNLTRDAFDVVFFPGGSGSRQAKGLGAEGLAAVQAFVSGGGGFIGTCAGAFLGMTSLRLYGVDLPLKSLGTGQVQMEFSEQGFEDLALDRQTFAGNVTIFYQGGPVVAAESLPANVSILAWYRSALPSWLPTPQGVNTPAVTSSTYGEGRVVLNSPHAEHTQSGGIGPAFYQGELAWILRMQAPLIHMV